MLQIGTILIIRRIVISYQWAGILRSYVYKIECIEMYR